MMRNVKVKTPIDMPDDMLKDAIDTVIQEFTSIEMDDFETKGINITKRIKEHMDEKWSPSWHVVIGRNFGSMVTHETRSFLYFYYNNKAVMMYKAG